MCFQIIISRCTFHRHGVCGCVCVLACVSVRRPFAIGPSRAPSARACVCVCARARVGLVTAGCDGLCERLSACQELNMYYTSSQGSAVLLWEHNRNLGGSHRSHSNNKVVELYISYTTRFEPHFLNFLRKAPGISRRIFLKVKKGTRHIRSHFLNIVCATWNAFSNS